MFSLFQSRNPLTLILALPFAFAMTWFHFLSWDTDSAYFSLSVFQKKWTLNLDLAALLYGTLLSMNSIVIGFLFNRFNLVDRLTYVPTLLYLIFTFTFLDFNDFNTLLADLFLITGFFILSQISNQDEVKALVFNSTTLFVFAVLLNIYYLFLLALPLVTLARNRSFVLREYLIWLMAILNILAYVAFYHYFYRLSFESPFISKPTLEFPAISYFSAIALSLILVVAAVFTRNRSEGSPGVRIDRILKLIFVGLIVQIVAQLAFVSLNLNAVLSSGIFMALYIGYAYNISKWHYFYNFVLYTILSLAILNLLT
jgi:hypothetical protein